MMEGVQWGLCGMAFSVINGQRHTWISLSRTLPSPSLKGQQKWCCISSESISYALGEGEAGREGKGAASCQEAPLSSATMLSLKTII